MRSKTVSLLILLVSPSALAHHSATAFFDRETIMEVEGTLTEIYWRNPHVGFKLDVVNDAGETVEWELEAGTTNTLTRRGFTADSLSIGERVRAAFAMAVESLEDPERAHRVIDMKAEIQDLVDEIIEHLAGRLVADDPDRSLLYRLETQAVEIMERRYYFARKIAKEVVREAEASMTDPVATAEPLA